MKYPHYPNGEPPNLRPVNVACCETCLHCRTSPDGVRECIKYVEVLESKGTAWPFMVNPLNVCDAHEVPK